MAAAGSQQRFYSSRIKQIMQSDEDVGRVGATVPRIMCAWAVRARARARAAALTLRDSARVLEDFAKELLLAAAQKMREEYEAPPQRAPRPARSAAVAPLPRSAPDATALTRARLKAAVMSDARFDFLRDVVRELPDHDAEEEKQAAAVGGRKRPAAAAKGAGPRRKRKAGEKGAKAKGAEEEEEEEEGEEGGGDGSREDE